MQGHADIRSIVQPIMRLAFSVEKIADRKLRKELGLSVSQFRILMVVRRGTDVRQRDIADYWGMAEASVSRQLESLRRLHLVARRQNQRNRREHVLELTPDGLAVIERAVKTMDGELSGIFSAVPERDRTMLAEGLRKLLEAFQGSLKETIPERLRDEKHAAAGSEGN